jgi:glycine betaine transporter
MSSRMKQSLGSVDPLVFGAAALIIGGFAAWGIIAPENLSSVIGGVLTWVLATFGWFYVFVAFVVLALSIFLMVHPWGRIRLGPDDSRPDFRTFTWIAMMFSAGLGSALMFYGVVEPLTHWAAPPHQLAEPRTQEAANIALQYTYFHWGFNGWAMYAVVGGSLAFFCYRKGMPMLLSSAFTTPLGPNAARRPMGRLIDVLGIVSTVFGMATSLGLNGLQLSGGLSYLFGTPNNNLVAVIIVASVTGLFLISATTGVEKGVAKLADIGVIATIALFFFWLFAGGATVKVISESLQTIGNYLIEVIPMSLITGVGDEEWMASWTIFYWAWLYSWGPFVGMFVARISRGRTIREFLLGTIAAPTGFGFLWFAAVGGTSIDIQESGRADLLAAVAESPQSALFAALDVLPIPLITSGLSVLLMVLFFVSGADAGAITMATMASRGSIKPAKIVVVTMGVLMGGVASAMLLAGGLEGLQQAAILGSGPFLVISMALCWYWVKALAKEGPPPREEPPPESLDASTELVSTVPGSIGRAGGEHDGVVEPPGDRDDRTTLPGKRDDVAKPAGEGAR